MIRRPLAGPPFDDETSTPANASSPASIIRLDRSGDHHRMLGHFHSAHDSVLTARRTRTGQSAAASVCYAAIVVASKLSSLDHAPVPHPKSRPRSMVRVALSNAMAGFEVLLSPAAEHRIEEERKAEILRIKWERFWTSTLRGHRRRAGEISQAAH